MVKRLVRRDIFYVKEMIETIVRPIFMSVISWKVGVENNFSVSFGKSGKFISKYLGEWFYQQVLETDSDVEKSWQSLIYMTDLFTKLSTEVASKLGFKINSKDMHQTQKYIRECYVKNSITI